MRVCLYVYVWMMSVLFVSCCTQDLLICALLYLREDGSFNRETVEILLVAGAGAAAPLLQPTRHGDERRLTDQERAGMRGHWRYCQHAVALPVVIFDRWSHTQRILGSGIARYTIITRASPLSSHTWFDLDISKLDATAVPKQL